MYKNQNNNSQLETEITDRRQIVPPMPPSVPVAGNRLTRWVGRKLLALAGWRLEGEFPDEPKIVIAAAPHTSNWDFVVAMLAIMALGVRVSYLMKKEAFIWPFGKLFMWLGGIPLDRSSTEDTVQQIISWYDTHDQVWVVITPEGTRAKVEKWKTGFLRVVEGAKVPLLLVAWDYPGKTIVLDRIWSTTGDHVVDAEAIRNYINSKYQGRIPENQ